MNEGSHVCMHRAQLLSVHTVGNFHSHNGWLLRFGCRPLAGDDAFIHTTLGRAAAATAAGGAATAATVAHGRRGRHRQFHSVLQGGWQLGLQLVRHDRSSCGCCGILLLLIERELQRRLVVVVGLVLHRARRWLLGTAFASSFVVDNHPQGLFGTLAGGVLDALKQVVHLLLLVLRFVSARRLCFWVSCCCCRAIVKGLQEPTGALSNAPLLGRFFRQYRGIFLGRRRCGYSDLWFWPCRLGLWWVVDSTIWILGLHTVRRKPTNVSVAVSEPVVHVALVGVRRDGVALLEGQHGFLRTRKGASGNELLRHQGTAGAVAEAFQKLVETVVAGAAVAGG